MRCIKFGEDLFHEGDQVIIKLKGKKPFEDKIHVVFDDCTVTETDTFYNSDIEFIKHLSKNNV